MDKMVKIAIMLTAYDKLSQVVNSAVEKSTRKLRGFEKLGHEFSEFSERALIGGEVMTEFFHKTIEAAEGSEVAEKRLKQVFKSMGQNYAEATEHATDYASKLSSQIGQEKELIMAVEAKMATFKKASNEAAMQNGMYQRSIRASFDMQATGFGDATQNAVQLGKALEDPIKGLNALRRSGITFTEVEKKKIKALVESGRLYKAQDYLMKAIEHQVGGVAKATATSTQKMSVAWHEVQVKIGTILLPLFEKLVHVISDSVIPKFESFIKKHPNLVKWVAILGASLLTLGTIAKIVAFGISGLAATYKVAMTIIGLTLEGLGTALMANPIMPIIVAIALAAYLIVKHWTPIKAFFIKLWNGIVNGVRNIWGRIVPFFTNIWAKVKGVFSTIWKGIKALIWDYQPTVLIYNNWSKITAFFTKLWEGIKNIFSGFVKWLAGLGSMFYQAGANIIKSIWNGMKSLINKPIDTIKNMVQKIRNFLPFSPAKTGPLRDIHKIKLVETIAASINPKPMLNAMSRVMGSVASYQPASTPALAQAGGGTVIHYSPTITGGNAADIRQILDSHSKDLMRLMDEENRKRNRTKF